MKQKIAELGEIKSNLKALYKTALKEKEELLENIFGLNKNIETANNKIRLQEGYENVLREKSNVINTCLEEIAKLKKLIEKQSEELKTKEFQYKNEISTLNKEVISLKKERDILETTKNGKSVY